MESVPPEVDEALRALIDECWDRCRWFLRRDYYPKGIDESLRVLDAIQRHGDRAAFRRAARSFSTSSSGVAAAT